MHGNWWHNNNSAIAEMKAESCSCTLIVTPVSETEIELNTICVSQTTVLVSTPQGAVCKTTELSYS